MSIRISDILTIKVNHAGSVKIPWMTPLRIWSERHGFTYDTAAEALGVSRRTYARMLKREVLPLSIILAMKWIDEERK